MVEILFRGKRCKNSEWAEGLLWHNSEKAAAIYADKLDRLCWVHPETVGQFTGKTDKNGKKIFKGDVARFENNDGTPAIWVVVWDENWGAWSFEHGESGQRLNVANICELVEIVGNRWDNPELLEVS